MGYRVRIHMELFPNVDFKYVFLDLTKILSVWSICGIYGHVAENLNKSWTWNWKKSDTSKHVWSMETEILVSKKVYLLSTLSGQFNYYY